MQDLLTKLLGPVFYGMGVSEADFASYLGMCMKYVYIILAALAVLIIVLIAAHKIRKGRRAFTRITAIVVFLLVVALIANLICFGPLRSNISSMLNSSKIELSEETIAASKDVVKRIGEEGFVLLKNEGLLPLPSDTKNLNVFGWASTNPILGGTGSGSSDGSSAVNILGSLSAAGYNTNADLTKIYTDYRTDRPSVAMYEQDWTLPEPTVEVYTDDVMSRAEAFSDTAVIVISRSGGEGADLPVDMNAVIKGTYNVAEKVSAAPTKFGYYNGRYTNNGDYDDFEPGEHYLELSVTEENMVEKVCGTFDQVVVVINANNAMELGWVDEYPQIQAVILAPGAGNTGLSALGEILSGEVNPSGRTVDTFVKDLTATPTWNNFGTFAYDNVEDLKKEIVEADGAAEGGLAFVNYVEGIYVGYKFYETAAEEGLIKYEDEVQYPFGYGLSYTDFEQKIENFRADDTSVSFNVTVTNTGKMAGKDVVEVYYTPPYENGGIEKASVNLIDFGKTSVLEPDQSETLSFSLDLVDLASYDSNEIKVKGGGYILEAGDYTISVRSDSHTVLAEETFTVEKDIDYSSGRPSDRIPAVNAFQEYSRGDFEQLSRKDGFKNYKSATAAPKDLSMSDDVRNLLELQIFGKYDSSLYDNPSDTMPTLGAKNGLALYQLTGKPYDDPQWDKLLDQLSFADMTTMINMGGWSTAGIASVGKLATSDCDGPAGLSNFITGAYGTAYPAEVLMAQTWNKDLVEEMGFCMGQEYQDANNYGWYGPAMNTHRNAFAGRNFEYYSEDGVLAGFMAAYELKGAVEKSVYPEIKHFALNDQEGSRCSFLLTWADEQAIREIYLRPFEMAVKNYKEGSPLGVMSSFNFIGTKPSCANPELLNTVLREEWGFTGMVETDYDGSYGYMIVDNIVRNGGDLMLGFGMAESNKLTEGSATLTNAMRRASKNILYTVGNSGYYTNFKGEGDPANQPDKMVGLFRNVDIGIGAGAIVIELLAALLFLRKKRERWSE